MFYHCIVYIANEGHHIKRRVWRYQRGIIIHYILLFVSEPLSQIKDADQDYSSIRLEFEVPCEDIPVNIITYNISYTTLSQSCSENEFNTTRWKSCYFDWPCEITGLHSYQDYYIQVQETAAFKVGIWSEAFLVKTDPYSKCRNYLFAFSLPSQRLIELLLSIGVRRSSVIVVVILVIFTKLHNQMELNMEGMIIERGDSVLCKWSSSLYREINWK